METDRSDVDKDGKLEEERKQRQIRRQSGHLKKHRRWVSGRFRATGELDYFRMPTIRELLGERPSIQELSIEDGSFIRV